MSRRGVVDRQEDFCSRSHVEGGVNCLEFGHVAKVDRGCTFTWLCNRCKIMIVVYLILDSWKVVHFESGMPAQMRSWCA